MALRLPEDGHFSKGTSTNPLRFLTITPACNGGRKAMTRMTMLGVAAAAFLFTAGCTELNKTESGALSGGAIGAGVGAAAGAITGGSATTGAVIGGAIGAAGGGYKGCREEGKC